MDIQKNTFILKRRNKLTTKDMPLLIGISGLARCGKDTLAKHLSQKLERCKLPFLHCSFAHAVKKDLDSFTTEKLNISAFTEDSREKDIIRPLLVAYATDVCRKLDKDFWIKKIEKNVKTSMNNKIVVLISDVRYENEVRWIKNNGGFVIYVKRMGNKPANFEEKANDPIVKKLADFKINWRSFGENEKEICQYHINRLFHSQNWSTYGNFK